MSAQAFHSNIHSRKITQMGSKGEQQFLHVTYHLDLIYLTNIIKISQRVNELLSPQAFPFYGQWVAGGTTIHEHDTPSWPDIMCIPNIIKLSEKV